MKKRKNQRNAISGPSIIFNFWEKKKIHTYIQGRENETLVSTP